MMRRSVLLSALALGLGMLAVPTAELRAESAERRVERFDVKTEKRTFGAARAIVLAPETVVRSVVTDYDKYPSFITRFRAAKIVGRVGDKTDVYLQVPIMKGTVKIWAVVRFDPPKTVGNQQVITGKMLKGNVKHLDAVWRIRKLDTERTELTLELAIVPGFPMPDSVVMPELRQAAARAVTGTRDEAERRATSS
ncbi:MAG: SRPBCC family protein [Pseudomonadota bacterium]